MLADFFTKPLQGSKFIKFKRIIMGWDHTSKLWDDTTNVLSPSKEQVGKNEKIVKLGDIDGTKERSWADIVKEQQPHNKVSSTGKQSK